LLAALDLVFELTLVLAELLDSFLHFAHFALLRINDVANALLDVLLLAVRIEVARNAVQELNRIVTSLLQLLFVSKHVEQFGARLRNLGCELSGRLEVLQFGRRVEIHHLHIVVIVNNIAGLHGLGHHLGNLKHFFHRKALCFV